MCAQFYEFQKYTYLCTHSMYPYTDSENSLIMKSSSTPNISNKETHCLRISMKVFYYWKCLIRRKEKKVYACHLRKQICSLRYKYFLKNLNFKNTIFKNIYHDYI